MKNSEVLEGIEISKIVKTIDYWKCEFIHTNKPLWPEGRHNLKITHKVRTRGSGGWQLIRDKTIVDCMCHTENS